MRIERELMRGAGPLAVLQLLEKREMYGYELVESLSEQTDGVLAMGQSTLYPLLYNLEAKSLVRSRWSKADSGRKRKYYGLTAKGRSWLEAHREQWHQLVGAAVLAGEEALKPIVFERITVLFYAGRVQPTVGNRLANVPAHPVLRLTTLKLFE